MGAKRLLFKEESANPTGTFKARGMAAALPFLDHFAAASTLADLAGLESQLNRM